MNRNVIFLIVAFFVAFADQLTKYFVRQKLVVGASVPVIDRVVYFSHVKNTGAAFGILPNGRIFIIVIGIISLIVILYFLDFFTSTRFLLFGGGFLFGGIIGNLLDRIFIGHVTDFIDFRVWPVFNLADSFVNIGISMIVVYILFFHGKAHS